MFQSRFLRRGALALAASLLLAGTLPASAATALEREEERSGGAMMMDVLVARPLGVGVTAVGLALTVVSAPFSLLGGNFGETADKLYVEPFAETFLRCVGCARVDPRVTQKGPRRPDR